MTTEKAEIKEETGEQVFVSPSAVVFVNIEYDQDTANPLEDSDGMGRIRSLSRRHINSIKSQDELDELLKDRDAVTLSYFEHGLCLWDVQDGERISTCPDMQWDGVKFAGVWTPDDCARESLDIEEKDGKDRREMAVKYATEACKVYTSWVNGEAYYYSATAFKPMLNKDGDVSEVREAYDELGEQIAEDSCGGFIGDMDYMIKENIQPFVDEHSVE